ncbi:hypothetical protein GeomeDRAFT_1519 [Geobacter metallireducens RCH3]|uniref:Uncharacterized protein n=1 Tax=Geobacter metallireducens (strain ATCC 53774 / DSM 7210 / GS-15) TaxID=269799 RepID=Q39RE3_GEOMG|nr:hypothetical protein [Geobacter metallireducens]ABB33181.1 hypothetical protein Gmet_2966 [Geobacter metallireducens GS-15]EHP87180.1 hypothetical protein GeomeDRAFT_1519 [Geobacter metallireducens RCH3]
MKKQTEINPVEFAKWFRELPEKEKRKGSQIEALRAEEDWENFSELFRKGVCSICNKPLKTFSVSNPCLHWLLKPKGFKKNHFKYLMENFRYFRISAYARWVAAIDGPIRNINDLKDEHSGNKIFDFTARYKHITWSYSCSDTDFKGHSTSRNSDFPHYHMQMYVNKMPFIKYNDFHIPFHNEDLCDLELLINNSDIVKHSYGRGDGMEAIFSNEDALNFIIDKSTPTTDAEAAFHMSTIVMAPEGGTISGDEIHEAFEEAKATGRTMASVLRERLKDANIRTIVSPGEGVPEAMPRSGRNKDRARDDEI